MHAMRPSVIALTVVPFCSVAALAQDQAGDELDRVLRSPTPDTIHFSLSGGYEFGLSADFDTSGDVSVSRFDVALGIRTRLEEELDLQASIGYGLDTYDFGGVTVFGATDPWEDIHMFSAGAIFSTPLNDEWDVYGGPFLSVRRESGADFDDGLTGGAFAAVAKRFSDELTIGGGLGFTTEIEDDGRVFPIIAVDWQINDDWRLATLTRAYRKGAEVVWSFDEGWEAGFGVVFAENRFRLDGDGVAPDGVGVDEFTAITARLSRDFESNFRLELIGGLTIGGEMELEASNGGNITRDDVDGAAFFGLRGQLRF